ncbi:MAG TPA: amino acid permease C-terminal domain-containing protein, partial [Nocardioides sp.]
MVNIGTLTAFALVSIAVPILRKRRPDLPRSFKVPFSPVLPIVAALICIYLTLNLSVETWLRFLVWMVIGFAIYFLYGYRNSRVGKGGDDNVVEPLHM